MELAFPEIVNIVQNIKHEQVGKNLIDSEIAALQCAWEGISYSEFVENQESFTIKYSSCYKKPYRIKKISSISTSASKLFRVIAEYYQLDSLSRTDFRRKLQELLIKPSQDKNHIQNLKSQNGKKIKSYYDDFSFDNEYIIVNQDIKSVMQTLESGKSIVSVYGSPGIGKTKLAQYTLKYFNQKFDCLSIYTDLRYIDSFREWAFEVLAQARINIEDDEELFRSLFELFDTQNVLLVIDSILNLDKGLKGFIEAFSMRNFSSKSILLLCSQKIITLNISSSLMSEFRLLGLYDKQDIEQFFVHLGLKNPDHWKKMNDFYGGNFREIQYAAQFILDFFDGDVGRYWQHETRIISPATKKHFKNIDFNQLNHKIFSMFSGEENHIISQGFRKVLSDDSSTSELFVRIEHLCTLGYLIQERDTKTNIVSYSIPPLLKQYLIQERIIGAK